MNRSKRYSPEVRERAVRTPEGVPVAVGRDGVDRDQDRGHAGDATHVGETKCDRHRSAGWNDVGGSGSTQGVATGEQGTETANEILKTASACFAQAELDRRLKRWSASLMSTRIVMGSSRSAAGTDKLTEVL